MRGLSKKKKVLLYSQGGGEQELTKQLTVNSPSIQTNYPIEVTLHNTTGTDTATDIYLGNNVRDDWGDIRFTNSEGAKLPWCILEKTATSALVAFNTVALASGDNTFTLHYNGAAADKYVIAGLTDVHHDPDEPLSDRDMVLSDFIPNFVSRMATIQPDLAVLNGDMIGGSSSHEPTVLGWYDEVLAAFLEVEPHATHTLVGVAPGNHDFDTMAFSNVRGKYTTLAPWFESGAMYGKCLETDDFIFLSLDANYDDADDSHLSKEHNGYGYVQPAQMTWLEAQLDAATKPVVIFIHQPCGELDTQQFTLTKALYHTQNRADIRALAEASGKVICFIHGHLHHHRVDVINGIPYLVQGTIFNSDDGDGVGGAFGEPPQTADGRWNIIELDKSNKTIVFKREMFIGGEYVTQYESVIPWGNTVFDDDDISNNAEKTFVFANSNTYERAAILRDPVQLDVNNDDFLWKYPANKHTPDPYISDNTIRIRARTASPSTGRCVWDFDDQTGLLQLRFGVRFASLADRRIKVGDSDVLNTFAGTIRWQTNGNVDIQNGAGLTTVNTYAIDTYYRVQLIFNVATDKYSVYINGVLEAEDFAFPNSKASLDRIELVTPVVATFYLNHLRVMPYVSPEPSITTVQ